MIGHTDWKIRVAALCDGQCTPEEADITRNHLDQCAECRAEFAFIQRTRELTKGLFDGHNLSEFFEQRLKARLRSETFDRGFRPVFRPALAVMTALVLIVLVSLSGFGSYAFALDGYSPSARVVLLSEAVRTATAKPGILNLVKINEICASCHDAVCSGCGTCATGTTKGSCCESTGGKR